MPSITEEPTYYLIFASLHLLLGQYGSAWVHRLRFRQNPLVIYESKEKTPHMRATYFVAVATLIWVCSILAFIFLESFRSTWGGKPLFIFSPFWGWGFGLLGLLGMVGAQYKMGSSFRVGQCESNPPPLVTSGMWQRSRNPIYIFSFLYIFAITLWTPCFLALVSCFFLGRAIHGLVLAEESFLEKKWGQEYRLYCENVPRYF